MKVVLLLGAALAPVALPSVLQAGPGAEPEEDPSADDVSCLSLRSLGAGVEPKGPSADAIASRPQGQVEAPGIQPSVHLGDGAGLTDGDQCLGRGNATEDALLDECRPCRVAGVKAPRLYIVEHSDGLGSTLLDVIAGMAVAAKSSFAFGGVVRHECHRSHGVDIMTTAGSVLGIDSPRLLFTSRPPKFVEEWPDLSALERGGAQFGVPGPNESILVRGGKENCVFCKMDMLSDSMSQYLTPRFLHELRRASHLGKQKLLFRKSRLSIALHVRRGDLDVTNPRSTSDRWYYGIIGQLQRLAPGGDIRVFSSLEGGHNSSEFDGYRSMNVTLHLDGDVLAPLSHFARAHVVVMAKSSFSYVSALFNSNCAVYQPYMFKPLDAWVRATDDELEPLDPAGLQALQDCLLRVQRRQVF